MRRENWIKWDLDSRSGFKMAGFVAEHGAEGYGVFVWLIELLYRTDNHKLPWANLPCSSQEEPTLCKQMQTYAKLFKVEQTKLQTYVEHLVGVGLLSFEEGELSSPRVEDEVGERKAQQASLSEKRKAAATVRWAKAAEDATANDCKPMQTDANPCQIRGDKKREDKKINKQAAPKYKVYREEDFPTAQEWSEPQRAAIARWVKYRADSGHPKLLESFQTEVAQLQDRPAEYVRLVERAIAQGWRGLNQTIPLANTNGQRNSAFEQNLAARDELIAAMRGGN